MAKKTRQCIYQLISFKPMYVFIVNCLLLFINFNTKFTSFSQQHVGGQILLFHSTDSNRYEHLKRYPLAN